MIADRRGQVWSEEQSHRAPSAIFLVINRVSDLNDEPIWVVIDLESGVEFYVGENAFAKNPWSVWQRVL